MKVLVLVVSSLLLGVALGLPETDTNQDKNVELLRDQIVRSKREGAREPAQKREKNIGKKRKTGNGKKNQKSKAKKNKEFNKKKKNSKGRGQRTGKKNKKIKKGEKNRKRKGKGNKKGNRKRTKGGKKSKKGKKRKMSPKLSRNTTTCTDSSSVSNDCLEDAVFVMKYLRNQVRTFGRKFARIQGFNKTIGKKLAKKGVFEETAKYLLMALGGNISSAACGEASKRSVTNRATNYALSNYTLLNNCSAAIQDACSLPDNTLNDQDVEVFQTCEDKFNQTKMLADDCRTNKKYTSDGTAACTCWSKIVDAIEKVRKNGTCNADDTNKGVKTGKDLCMTKFSECRKAEDAAVQLVYTCSSGDVANSTKSAS